MDNIFKINYEKNNRNKSIKISGAKNAILPLMIAKILVPGRTTFKNIPNEIEDFKRIYTMLQNVGLNLKIKNKNLVIDNFGINNIILDNSLTRYSRYSSLFFGILAKFDNFKIGWCGGCNIGNGRPLDIHFDGFSNFGFNIVQNENYIEFNKCNIGKNIYKMRFPSVGATFNFIFYGVQQKNFSVVEIDNCAIEPEIENVIKFLNLAGYKIKLYKRLRKIIIKNNNKIKDVEFFNVLPDRIETITYCILSAILNKTMILYNIDYNSIKNSLLLLKSIGIPIEIKNDKLKITKFNVSNLKGKNIVFKPYPGIPTDIQPLITLLLSFCHKKSFLIDTVYPDRIEYLRELNKVLNIKVDNSKIIVNPIKKQINFCDNFVATDIRGGMSCLILASYLAKEYNKEITINNIYQIKRGYNNLINNFKKIGIKIIETNK